MPDFEKARAGAVGSCPAEEPLSRLIAQVLPGASKAVHRLRRQVLQFCANPSARSVLLRGPIGAGKSTVAPLIALGKYVAPLRREAAETIVADLRLEAPGRIDRRLLPWFVEFPVTGLSRGLAERALFGITAKAATGVAAGPGIFEQAATGRGSNAGATGGVVFLDEIADIPDELQAKLLPVLSGGKFYRLGGEGTGQHEQTYNGVVISASWKDPQDSIRPDLLSRLAEWEIALPSLAERSEDVPTIVDAILQAVTASHYRCIDEMVEFEPRVDTEFYKRAKQAVVPISSATKATLSTFDWSRHGDLRGLVAAVKRIAIDRHAPTDVLQDLPETTSSGVHAPHADSTGLLERLLVRGATGESLVSHVSTLEKEERKQLKKRLRVDLGARTRVTTALGIEPGSLMKQLHELTRTRRRAPEKADNP